MKTDNQDTFFKNPKAVYVVLGVLLLIGFFVRMLDLTDPPMDFHPTRQMRGAINARSIFLTLNPSADPENAAFATSPSLLDYVGRLEPPITESLVALIYLMAGQEVLWASRIVTSLIWCIGGLALFLIAQQLSSADGALVSLGFYLFAPFGIIASRSFQPEPLMIASMLWSVFLFIQWKTIRSWPMTVLVGLVSGFAMLVKPNTFFFLFPLFSISLLVEDGVAKSLKNRQVWALLGLTAILPGMYYFFINPGAGGFHETGLRDALRLVQSPGFYLGWAGIINDVVGASVMIIGLSGAVLFHDKNRLVVLVLWVGYLILGVFFAYHIHTHDYYSLIFIPVVAISLGSLGALAAKAAVNMNNFWKAALIIVGLIAIAYPSWTASKTLYQRDYRGEPGGWRQVGQAIPDDLEVIALTHIYGHYLAYYGYRQVHLWPHVGDQALLARLAQGEMSDFEPHFLEATRGFDLFLVTHFAELENQPALKQSLLRYPVYSQSDAHVLYDLRQ